MLKYFYAINYLLILVFGVIYYYKYSGDLRLKLFLGFIIYSFVTEILGLFFAYYLKMNTNIIYNTWNIVNHLFYAFFFLSEITNKNKRNMSVGFISVYLLFSVVNVLFLRSYVNQILINNILFGSILIVVTIMIYYTELLNSEAILSIKDSLFFWISVAVLLSNIILIPVWVFAEFFSFQGIFRYLIFASNIIMSLCFISGFVFSKTEIKS